MNKMIIITGTPADGFRHYGNFDSHEIAADWAEKELSGDWWIVPLEYLSGNAEGSKETSAEDSQDAMAIWEELLHRKSDRESPMGNFLQLWESIGTCEMRSYVFHNLLPLIKKAWLHIQEEYPEPFDWEFVPGILTEVEEYVSQDTGVIEVSDEKLLEIAEKLLAQKEN